MTGRDVADRFWPKVDKSAGLDGCWPWKAASVSGYGKFKLEGRYVGAHRVSLMITHPDQNGEGLLALHSCRNPICVNPNHLRWGTRLDNAQDAIRDGSYIGRRQSAERPSEAVVARIRNSRLGCRRLGAEVGLPHQTVAAIRKGIGQ